MSIRSGLFVLTFCVFGFYAIISVEAGEVDQSPLAKLRVELAKVRLEVAKAKLELQKTLKELEELREFLADSKPETSIEKWRKQRKTLETKRERTITQRRKLEQASRALRDAMRKGIAGAVKSLPPALPASKGAPKWDIDYKLAVIRTGTNTETIYVDTDFGEVILDRYPDVDRKNVELRGTLRNKSTESWRYTFEVRVASKAGAVIGRWRYQTPSLTPGKLHSFNIKIPVTDVAKVHKYQVGKVRADKAKTPAKARPRPLAPLPPLRPVRPDGKQGR